MKTNRLFSNSMRLAMVLAMAMWAGSAGAQYLRTSYFMDSSPYRLQLNPALPPDRGFVLLPAVGHVNASLHTNSLGFNDVVDMVENTTDADYFTSVEFMDKLNEVNTATINMGTDALAVGWWHGKSFMSINFGFKVNGDARVPKEYFAFLRDMKGLESNDYSNYVRDIRNQELNINAYTEVGFGYSRCIGDRVNLGGRVKALFGLGNLRVKMHDAVIKTNVEGLSPDFCWTDPDPAQLASVQGTASFDVHADMECSFQGLELPTNASGYIDDIDFDSKKMGVAGYGAAVDLGVAVQVTDAFSLSAAMTDLGFINWSRKSTTIAHSNTEGMTFSSDNPAGMGEFVDAVGSAQVLNYDLLRFDIDETADKSRRTSLASTLAVGGDFKLADDKLKLGVLYTNRFSEFENEYDLTFSANYHPVSLLDLALSYSPIMCGGKSFGVALKLGPLFVGTDYMYLGKNNRCSNVLVGLSIPLGRKSNSDI